MTKEKHLSLLTDQLCLCKWRILNEEDFGTADREAFEILNEIDKLKQKQNEL